MPRKSDLLYTSFSDDEPRLGSPGKFVLGVDGSSSQPGSLTVYVDWTVTLSGPSLELDAPAAIPTAKYSVWSKAGSSGLWALKDPNKYDTLTQKASVAFPGVPNNSTITLPGMRGFTENKDNAAGTFVAFHKIFVDASGNMWPRTVENTKIETLSFGHTLILDRKEPVEFESVSLNRQRGLMYLSYQSPSSELQDNSHPLKEHLPRIHTSMRRSSNFSMNGSISSRSSSPEIL